MRPLNQERESSRGVGRARGTVGEDLPCPAGLKTSVRDLTIALPKEGVTVAKQPIGAAPRVAARKHGIREFIGSNWGIPHALAKMGGYAISTGIGAPLTKVTRRGQNNL